MTDHIPPQQELETLSFDDVVTCLVGASTLYGKSGAAINHKRMLKYIAELNNRFAQTRTDTIREVEEQHQVEVLQVRIDEIGRHPSRGDSLKYYQRRKKQLEAQLEQLKGQK